MSAVAVFAKLFDDYEALLERGDGGTRVWFETNVTPRAGWRNPKWASNGNPVNPSINSLTGEWSNITNPDWLEHAYSLGFKPYAMAYSGTLNQAFSWCDDAGNPRPLTMYDGGGAGYDGSRERNASDPIDLAAVRAIARASANPSFYGYSGPPRPVVFDIEAADALVGHSMYPPASAPTEVRRVAAQLWLDAVRVCRAEGVGMGIFFGPPWWPDKADSWDLEGQLLSELDSVWVDAYTTDDTSDPAVWKAQMDRVEALMLSKSPKTRAVALMSPWWQASLRAGQPVDIERWRWQAEIIRSKPNWDIGLWVEGGTLEGVKGHLEAMAEAVR